MGVLPIGLIAFLLMANFTFLSLAVPPPGEKIDCSESSDCPPYHYCFSSAFLGSRCVTNFEQRAWHSTTYCLNKFEGRIKYPDHKRCKEEEIGDNPAQLPESQLISVKRCYAELGYTCAVAFHTPCTEEFDDNGNVIDEEVCPENFKCDTVTYRGGDERKVCLPNPVPFATECEHPFDCGFSKLENTFPRCIDGRCARAIE